MAVDGSLMFDTKIDSSAFSADLQQMTTAAAASANNINNTLAVEAGINTNEFISDLNEMTAAVSEAAPELNDGLNANPGVDTKEFESGVSNLKSIANTALGQLAADMVRQISAIAAQIPQQMIAVGSDFESSMSQVAATMGITSATEEFDTLSAAAKEMGETTKFSASQAGEALNYLALAGYDAEKAVDTLPTVLNVAAAGGMELAAASDMVTDAMSALGLETSQMADFSDKLAVTAQKSNTSVSQLGEAILTVGGTAKNLAGGVTELNTMLGVLADNGIKGSEGGTALRNVILSLSAPTDTAAEALEQLGVSAFDLSGNMRPLEDTFADLNSALGELTQQQRTEVLNEIFNKVDLKSVNALLGTSAERFDELSGYIDDCSGAAAQMAETMDDTLKGDLTILNSALEGLGIAAYEKFQVPMRTAVQEVTESVGELTASLTDGELSDSFDKIASGLSEVLGNVLEIVADDVLPAMITGFAWIVDNGAEVTALIASAAAAMVTYKVAVNGAKIAQEALNAVMKLNPYAIALSAVVALGTAIDILANKMMDASLEVKQLEAATDPWLEQSQKAVTALQEERQAFEDLIDTQNEKIEADEAEINNISRLWNELQNYVDETGNVITENERVSEIIGLLNENYGMNIEYIDGQIQGYQELAGSMDEYIEKLRMESRIRNGQGAYDEAIAKMDEYEKRRDELVEKQKILAQAISIAQTPESRDAMSLQWAGINDQIAELDKAAESYQQVIDEYESLFTDGYSGGNSGSGFKSVQQMQAEEYANDYVETMQTAAKKAADQQEENTKLLEENWKRLKHEYAVGSIATEEELYAKKTEVWNAYGDESLQEHWSFYEDLCAYEKDYAEQSAKVAEENKIAAEKLAEEQKKQQEETLKQQLENQEKIVDDGLSEILKKYQNAYDELDKKRENYNRKLMSIGGDIFSVETVKDENGNENTTYTINNIDEQIKKMREYNAAVKKLKEQGASGSLLEELTSMDNDESANFAKYLSEMSDAEFAKINELYEEKQRVADELSRELYASDAQKISDTITAELGDLATSAYDYGAQSAKQFAAGFSESMSELGFNAFYGQLEAAGANRSYANYPSFTKNVSEQALTVALDVTGKSNVILDGNVIGQLITNYQGKKAKQTGG